MKKKIIGLFLAAAMSPVLAAWPDRPVRIIVPYTPGGLADSIARLTAEGMYQTLGQPVVIENRPGASTTIGVAAVTRAPADGYTVLLAPAAISVNAAMGIDLPYDHRRDLVPVIELGRGEGVVAVHHSVKARNLRELSALAKAEPGKYSVATAGKGTNTHLALAQFSQESGAKFEHIPYKGGSAAVNDVAAGHVPIIFGGITEINPHVKSGRLRAIAVLEPKRSAELPAVPTAIEQGFPGLRLYGYMGLMVRSGTPPEIVQKLYKAAADSLKRPQAIAAAKEAGIRLVGGSPDAFRNTISETDRAFSATVKAAGNQLD